MFSILCNIVKGSIINRRKEKKLTNEKKDAILINIIKKGEYFL